MRAIFSYGVALVIVLVLAVWLATGTLINGGHGPGAGEKPVVSLIEKNGGPLTNAVDKSGINLMELARTWDLKFFWDRLAEPYAKVTLFAWICCWVVPFWVLLGQRPKRTPAILGSVAAVVLFGFWLERNVLVWPSLVPKESLSFVGPVQLGVALGFAGAFALVFLVYTRVFPSLAVSRR